MKRKSGLMLFALASFAIKAQVVLTEDFNAPFVPGSSNSWTVINNSAPLGNLNWFQGNAANSFPAYNGGANDYYAANFNSTSASSGSGGTINNWLISPVVSLVNGGRIEFATRTIASPTVYPDRLQVLICPTSTFALGSTGTSPFSVIFDVNSALSTATTAALNNSVVTGYPQGWTVYTATVAGITGTVNGRFAFRYFVTNGGSVGANSNYVGLDAVKYSLPCAQPSMAVAATNTGICSGTTVGLSVSTTGSVAANSYTWSTGSTGSLVAVTPSATTIYMVSGESSPGCIGTQTVAVTVTATPNMMVPSYTVCSSPSTPATLTASGATSYTWNTSATTASIAVNPTATTVYTVTGSAANGACPSMQTATITIGTGLSVDIMASASTICAGNVVTLSAISAGTTYSWSTGSTAPSITVNPSSSTGYTVGAASGALPFVCVGINNINILVNASPTLSASQSGTICSGSGFTTSASGANNYLFMLGQVTSTSNPASFTAPFTTSATIAQYMVTGTSTNGCSSSGTYTFNVIPAPQIVVSSTKPVTCINSVLTLSASGANTYTWSNNGGNNANVSYTTGATSGNVSYTISGTSSSGCSASYEFATFISTCAGLDDANGNAGLKAFPNPFNESLNIQVGEVGKVMMYNVLGELVLSAQLSEELNTISTSAISAGVYTLKAYNAEGKEMKSIKVIKQ